MKITLLVLFLLLITTAIKLQVTQEWVASYNELISGADEVTAINHQGDVYVTGYSS